MDWTLIWKFVKFCVVGFSGMVVDFGVTWLCKEKLHWNKYLSNSLGFVLAAYFGQGVLSIALIGMVIAVGYFKIHTEGVAASPAAAAALTDGGELEDE